jgi:hypothetical protein
MTFAIEKNVPMPTNDVAGPYPLREMEIGDSFYVPRNQPGSTASVRNKASKIGIKVSIREDVGGFRVWRVA